MPAGIEQLAKDKPSLSVAVRALVRAGIPAPGGKAWHRQAVYRIARRLGIKLGTGRAFGEWPRCTMCNKQVGRVFSEGYCLTCRYREHAKRVHGDMRRADLAEAREKLRYYQDKVQALEAGRRHYSRQHPKPKRRFGRPIS